VVEFTVSRMTEHVKLCLTAHAACHTRTWSSVRTFRTRIGRIVCVQSCTITSSVSHQSRSSPTERWHSHLRRRQWTHRKPWNLFPLTYVFSLHAVCRDLSSFAVEMNAVKKVQRLIEL